MQEPTPQQTDLSSVMDSTVENEVANPTPARGKVKVPTSSPKKSARGENAPGLSIERRFTKAGEDVYSTVEWELRNAVISNERGEKVFEQTDVEIPKSWTQLATNVVVSKYFRGHIGTPTRERSVRQLIGRVSDTIANWGRGMDYFATEADAQTFNDELTHILLYQKAAFNSPVWFNVGLQENPRPQCSACFINAVDDTMESILTLAKTEGMLFKFGSGTGTNLSPIRSSYEHLKGGGTASGPLSFMRGFDQFAGAIKCLTPDAYVYTDKGMQTLGEIISPELAPGFHEDQSVVLATKDDPTRISHVYVSPEAPTYRMQLRHTGLSLRGTGEHPVLTLTPDFRLVWKKLEEVTQGDKVAVSRRTEMWPTTSPSFDDFVPVARHAKKTLQYPATMTPELARLLGYMISEGSLDPERFRFSNADKDVFDDFIRCVHSVFGIGTERNISSRTHPTTGVTTWLFEACWTNAVRFLMHIGLTEARSAEKVVPWSIRLSQRPHVVEFLKAYFEGDGHISNHVYAASASRQLLSEVQLLLMNMGMVPALRPHPVNGKTYWNLYLRGEQAWLFVREVGFISERKREAMQFAGDKNTNVDSVPFLADVLRTCVKGVRYFQCDDGEVRSLGFGFFNRKPHVAISYNCLRNAPGLVQKASLINAEWGNTLQTILEKEFFWDTVSAVVEAEPAVTYDFTVPETHSFIANGIVNHNSGGKTRRAAKMVMLDIDHPDIEDFITCKAKEEKKAWALIDAGYSGAFNVPGGAYDSVSFQNGNNSVRVSDEFMEALAKDGEWWTRFVTTKEKARQYKARDLMNMIAESAWVCGDPGMQYDTTINKWHTCKNTAPIYGSNPCCVTGDTLVAVADGRNAVPIKDLVGTEVPVYAHDHSTGKTVTSRMWNIGVKRRNVPVYRVTLDDGSDFRATDDHLIMLRDGSYRMVRDLTPGTSLMPFHSKVLSVLQNRTRRRYFWSGRSWKPQYRAVWEHANGKAEEGYHIHHRDFNALNDTLTNLEPMLAADHAALHGEKMRGDNNPARRAMNDVWRKHISEAVSGAGNGNFGNTHSPETRALMREKSAIRWADPEERKRSGEKIRAALAKANSENRSVGRPRGERFERCCPVCRANYLTARVEQIFCSSECRYSPMGRMMSGEKTAIANRGRSLSSAHRDKISASSRAASTPEMKRRAAEQSHRNTILKAARLMLDQGIAVTSENWEALRSQMREGGAGRVPTVATVNKHFATNEALQEEAKLYNHKVVSVEFCGYEDVYDGTVDQHHNFAILTSQEDSCVKGELNFSGLFIHNSEYMFLNDSACNLASLNLMKFRHENGEFDVEAFQHACRVVLTAQEIIVDNASYPTPRIEENSRDYRPLGLGYANLGALLMARGLAYDSDEGRAYAGAITAIMTGEGYHQSSIIARDHGWTFNGYAKNREPFLEVMKMHRAAVEEINPEFVPDDLLQAARKSWDNAIEKGEQYGYRNAQATVLAPTGCLVAGSMVLTDRGLLRLNRLGDVNGAQWQDVRFRVLTDEGEKSATKFYINGAELTRKVTTASSYEIQGTLQHRIKVVDGTTGEWLWKRFSDIRPGDVTPISMGKRVGEPNTVLLPPLGEEYWTGDYTTRAPREMSADLAELIGYFMGDGSLHTKGPRFCVANADEDVAGRISSLLLNLFNLKAFVTPQEGYYEVSAHSVPLSLWWDACGFSKFAPHSGHKGKGYRPHIPDAVLATNDAEVYGAFLRGLYEADGTVTNGVPCWTTAHGEFAGEVRTLLLSLGIATTTRLTQSGWGKNDLHVLRLRNTAYNPAFLERVGFMGERKVERVSRNAGEQTARYDYIYLSAETLDELLPHCPEVANAVALSRKRHGNAITRRAARTLLAKTSDPRLAHALDFYYDEVKTNEDGGEQLTYDLSVPENVTYVANGFVSHNTIGFLMDCDTTGIEPDIAIVKYKSLVGGGMLKIVNNTVPEALNRLGYTPRQVDEIIAYIDKHDTIEGAPELKAEHLTVFDCAFKPANGVRSIHYNGHLKMMAAAQPFLSGAISKTVNMPHDATAEEIAQTYVEGWKMGLKAIAIYRDGSKRTQPLMTKHSDDSERKTEVITLEKTEPEVKTVVVNKPMRRKLPDERHSITHKFSIAGHEGYITVGMYEDGTPGEIFLTMSKEGSTISGLMDSFATAISLALQYGVPLQTLVGKFSHARFEPSGYTNNPEIRIAKSITDYIFRWLGSKFLAQVPTDDPADASDIETEALNTGMPPFNRVTSDNRPVLTLTDVHDGQALTLSPEARDLEAHEKTTFQNMSDAPVCADCGSLMVRNGACFKCLNCGSVFGCS